MVSEESRDRHDGTWHGSFRFTNDILTIEVICLSWRILESNCTPRFVKESAGIMISSPTRNCGNSTSGRRIEGACTGYVRQNITNHEEYNIEVAIKPHSTICFMPVTTSWIALGLNLGTSPYTVSISCIWRFSGHTRRGCKANCLCWDTTLFSNEIVASLRMT